MQVTRLSAAQLNETLHDALVDLDEVQVDHDTVVLHGSLDKPTGASPGSQLGRYPFQLVITGAEQVEVVDRDGVGVLPVEQVAYDQDAGVLRLTMVIPGHVAVQTRQQDYQLRVQATPTHVRRWWRWRPVPPPR
jgi:hypothetical protein